MPALAIDTTIQTPITNQAASNVHKQNSETKYFEIPIWIPLKNFKRKNKKIKKYIKINKVTRLSIKQQPVHQD